jgi:hypothetical protein
VTAGSLAEVKSGVALVNHGDDNQLLTRATGAMVEAQDGS